MRFLNTCVSQQFKKLLDNDWKWLEEYCNIPHITFWINARQSLFSLQLFLIYAVKLESAVDNESRLCIRHLQNRWHVILCQISNSYFQGLLFLGTRDDDRSTDRPVDRSFFNATRILRTLNAGLVLSELRVSSKRTLKNLRRPLLNSCSLVQYLFDTFTIDSMATDSCQL